MTIHVLQSYCSTILKPNMVHILHTLRVPWGMTQMVAIPIYWVVQFNIFKFSPYRPLSQIGQLS